MSTQKGLMIVDGALPDRAVELATFMDSLTTETPEEEGHEGAFAKMAIELRDTEDSEQRQDIFLAFAESSGLILKAPVADIEPAFNLLLFVLSRAPDFGILVPVLLSQLEVDTNGHSVMQLVLLAILGNLFSIMPENIRKYDVLIKLLHASDASSTLGQLVPQLSKVSGWLKTWGASTEQSATFYETALNLLGNRYPTEARELLLEANRLGCGQALATRLAVSVLEDDSTFNLDDICALSAVTDALKADSDLATAFSAVASGDCALLARSSYGSNEKICRKARVISLARLAQSQSHNESNQISYEDIIKSAEVPAGDVEELIIETIRAGLILGRMDQVSQTLFIERASIVPNQLTLDDWKAIDGWLLSWRNTLEGSRQRLRKTEELWERLYV